MTDLLDRLNAAFQGQYRVERELGRGGMAHVYLAEDLKHGRQVAIKILPQELSATLGVERFTREIGFAARLSHPHILSLHDSGQADSFLYYVMPYVPGESLRDRLEREEQLPLEDALLIAREVADGLSHAHSYGVVHRDIKPENILLTGGHAIIADFGVARAVSVADDDQLTQTGVAIGTPAYMSPEQASGKTEIDGRSDQYALGCLLFEMLAGQPPFSARTTSGLLTQHLSVPPPPVAALRPSVPAELAALLQRLLAKAPADRYQTAAQVVQLLASIEAKVGTGAVTPVQSHAEITPPGRRRPSMAVLGLAVLLVGTAVGIRLVGGSGTEPPEEPPRRLVVLPLVNRGDAQDEYYADGITDEITDRLSGIDRLMVIARASAMRYKATTLPIRDIAQELGVDYILTGSVTRERLPDGTGSIRVSGELINASDETRIWADNFEAALSEVFRLQTRIAEQVAGQLDITLAEPERLTLANLPTEDVEAHDYYLRGNDYFNRGWAERDVRTAVDLYERAVAADSSFAQAYALLSKSHSLMYQLRYDRSQERLHSARQAGDRALALAPDLPAAHEALGHYYYWGFRDYEPAIREFEQALDRQPNNATVRNAIANVRRRQGRWDDAIRSYESAAELDPRSHIIAQNLGEAFYLTRRYDRAEDHLDRAIALAPDFLDSYIRKAMLFINGYGDVERARAVLEEAERRIDPAQWRLLWFWWGMGLFRTVARNPDDELNRMRLGAYGADSSTYYLARAEWHARAGQPDRSQVYYDSARVVLEDLWQREPEWARYQGELAVAYAGLGQVAQAATYGRFAQQFLPVDDDALDGPDWVLNMARIEAVAGNYEAAVEYIAQYLSIPSRLSRRWFEIDPFWKPVLDVPGFRDLVSED